MTKRVLVLSYYFPPAGGPGVQRVLKFVKYLPEFGWQPDVMTVRGGSFPGRDESLERDIPPGTRIIRTRTLDPFALYAKLAGRGSTRVPTGSVISGDASWLERLSLWIRANVFIPDARVGWFPFALLAGLRALRSGAYDALVTSGPPHSTHLIGMALHRLTKVPWLADFRDPWTDINYYRELPHAPWTLAIDRSLERTVLRGADVVTTVSPGWRMLLTEKRDRGEVALIENGFDESDFENVEARLGDSFTITHVGSLYASRNPHALWDAIRALRNTHDSPVRVRLVGTVDSAVREAIRDRGLEEQVEILGYVPHFEAIAEMISADLLLLVVEDFPEARGMITGKLYEYLASGRPVLGLGPERGDAAQLVGRLDAGRFFSPANALEVAGWIDELRNRRTSGRPVSGASPREVEALTRRAQTGALARLLSSISR